VGKPPLGTPPDDKAGAVAAAAAAADAPSPLDWVARAADMDEGMASRAAENPTIFKTFLRETLAGMKQAKGRGGVYETGNVRLISDAQTGLKSELLRGARGVVQGEGLSPSQVISHGTNMKGLLGMLMEGKIVSTTRHAGVSGEGANVWGAEGLETGASYGATTGLRTGQPSVEILMRASPTLKVEPGSTLSRAPGVNEDFLAAIVTDGRKTVVLGKPQLDALAGSARAWRTEATAAARAGRMGEFSQWENVRDRLVPR
ncbi:MAG: hypothetical protein KGM24_03500, partial [Elusimicrobia bacterium]|nr:hypothetical protein [Elusimicrobiota bacterium]